VTKRSGVDEADGRSLLPDDSLTGRVWQHLRVQPATSLQNGSEMAVNERTRRWSRANIGIAGWVSHGTWRARALRFSCLENDLKPGWLIVVEESRGRCRRNQS